jgi:Leucine-rich repeat (LRR) protein
MFSLKRGTDAILKSLKLHIEIPSNEELNNQQNENKNTLDNLKGVNSARNDDIKYELVRSSRTFDYSSRKASVFPLNYLTLIKQSSVHTINLSKNSIKTLPDEFETFDENLTMLNYGFNQLDKTPDVIFKLKNLVQLDLRGNNLINIDDNIQNLGSLRELIIADNKFADIPNGVYNLKNLENLFANGNKIKVINVNGLKNLRHLSTLNLQNNDIATVPPELGKLPLK